MAGRGWGRLSPLSCGWPGGSLPSQWTGEQEPFGVSTSDLVNICIVCFFLNYGRDSESPQQNRSPLSPRNVLHTLSLARRSCQGLPHPGQSPMCLVQEPSAPEMGPAEGTTATQQERGPHPVPFAPPPLPLPLPLRLPGDEGVQLTPPFSVAEEWGWADQTFAPVPSQPSPCFVWTCVSQDFLRTKNKQTKN